MSNDCPIFITEHGKVIRRDSLHELTPSMLQNITKWAFEEETRRINERNQSEEKKS
jgi:hypothetical protein